MNKLGILAFTILGVTAISIVLQSNSTEAKTALSASPQPKSTTASFSDKYTIKTPPIPAKVTFCNEEVPMSDWEVKERLEREMFVNTYWQSNTMLMLKRSARFFPKIDQVLKEEGVPLDFKYLAVAESGLTEAISPSGAHGIWQFMKTTALGYDLKVTSEVDERHHLEKATRAACKYLKNAKEELGTWTLAAAAYNRGLSGVQRDLKSQGVDNYHDLRLNSETSRYVFRIIALKHIFEKPAEYGFIINPKEYYNALNTYNLVVDSTITDLAQFAIDHGTTYKHLKLINPWLRDDHLTVSKGESYVFEMPEVLAQGVDENSK